MIRLAPGGTVWTYSGKLVDSHNVMGRRFSSGRTFKSHFQARAERRLDCGHRIAWLNDSSLIV
jgi:hypothetical protein